MLKWRGVVRRLDVLDVTTRGVLLALEDQPFMHFLPCCPSSCQMVPIDLRGLWALVCRFWMLSDLCEVLVEVDFIVVA